MTNSHPDHNNGHDRDALSIPKEHTIVNSGCGVDGGADSFAVPNGEPSFCPWCGPVDRDVTSVSSAETEPTAILWEERA